MNYWLRLRPRYRKPRPQSQFKKMVALSQWALTELEHVIGLVSSLYTLVAFLGALLLLPLGGATYLVVCSTQHVFLYLLARRYPQLEFVRTTSLRTAIDTHRNQGVISLLLQVKGSCDPDQLRAKLEENVLERRDASGTPCYPHMKTPLTTKWGRYAWEKPTQTFRVENHLTVGSSVFRGRPVTEANIQECVSDIVSKYLPPDLSPWQLTLIPTPARFYLLIRIHHLLLSEDRVGLGDLLLLRHDKTVHARRLGEDDENFAELEPRPYRPLTALYRPPAALPRLARELADSVSRARALVVRLAADRSRGAALRMAWWLAVTVTLNVPLALLRETLAMVRGSAAHYPGTAREWLARYWPLVSQAAGEALHYLHVIYTGPRVLVEELVISHRLPRHQLQTVSLCGRKVVAWSEEAPLELVRRIEEATGVSQSDVLTSATAGALREYFQQFGLAVPDTVLTTARFFPEETLLATSRTFETGVTPSTGGGSLCVALPTGGAPLHATARLLEETRRVQPILYLASLWQLEKGLLTRILPTMIVRLILNYLTRRYAVSLTEVASGSGSDARRQLLWGQEVESIMYWRPPQANICLSLTVMSYGHAVRLGVMSDALLSPHHSALAAAFTHQLNQLAVSAGIPLHSSG